MAMRKVFGTGEALPTPVTTVRVLLFVIAGLMLLLSGGLLAAGPLDVAAVSALLYLALPGVLAFVLARNIARGGRSRFWLIIALAVVLLLQVLANILAQPIQAMALLILPILTLVFVLLGPSRDHFTNPPQVRA